MLDVAHTYGSGTIYRRGSRWWIRYYVNGKPFSESARTTSKRKAHELLVERLAGRNAGLSPATVTVGDLLDLWIADQETREAKGLAKAKGRAAILRKELGHLRCRQPERISQAIENFVQRLVDDGRAGATINRYRAAVRRGYALAAEEGLTLPRPVWRVRKEAGPRRASFALADYELIRDALNEPFRSVVIAALWTGCRRGEILGFKWKDVDLEKRGIYVPDSKNGEPREVPISAELYGALVAAKMRWPDCEWVFTWDGVRPLSGNSMRSAWDRAREHVGRPDVRMHDLRHEAVNIMREAGVSRPVAMSITGHRSEYVHAGYGVEPFEQKKQAVQAMEQLIERKRKQRPVH